MNKTWLGNRKISFILFLLCLILFNISCGLDTYIVMDTPVSVSHVPEYNISIQYDEKYFEFETIETNNYPDGFEFLGTDIYYKIYNNSDSMKSERSVLESYASNSDSSSKAPEKLINPTSSGGYGFKQLKSSNGNSTPLIVKKNRSQRVEIRLADYQSMSEYSSKLLVDGANLNHSSITSKPVRFENDYTFNFGKSGSTLNKIPVSSDKDVKYGSFTEPHKWYVMMFAVGVGRDATYANYYSNIVYLGSVSITDDGSED